MAPLSVGCSEDGLVAEMPTREARRARGRGVPRIGWTPGLLRAYSCAPMGGRTGEAQTATTHPGTAWPRLPVA